MKKSIFPFILVGLLAVGCSEEKGPKGEEPDVPGTETKLYQDVEPLEPLSRWDSEAGEEADLNALNDFAYRLNSNFVADYDNLWGNAPDHKGNYSFSPLSISVFLSAVSQSVDGQARQDICDMLGIAPKDAASLNNKLIRYLLGKDNGAEVHIANSVWHVSQFPVLDSYKSRMAELFGAPVNELDLYSPESKDIINSWCSDKTHGMIPEVFKNAPCYDFIIANALYFSADWSNPFNEELTDKVIFHGTEGEAETDLMHKPSDHIYYSESDGIQYASLNMLDGFTMDIVMPAEGTDLEEFGKTLGETIVKLKAMKEIKDVDLYLPRFKEDREADIIKNLRSLGYPDYDMPTKEMTGTSDHPLMAAGSLVEHLTSLEVKEEGVKLAAVTVGGYLGASGETPEYEKVTMRVDRPFYYVIRDYQTGIVLMIGRVCNL